jgi:hypothetical protein
MSETECPTCTDEQRCYLCVASLDTYGQADDDDE